MNGAPTLACNSAAVIATWRTLTTSTRAPAANADGWGTDFEQVIVFDRS